MFFDFVIYQKFNGGDDTYKMSKIKIFQSCWNFAQLKEIRK